MNNVILLILFIPLFNLYAAPAPFDRCEELEGWSQLPKCNEIFSNLESTNTIKGHLTDFNSSKIENPCLFLFGSRPGDIVCAEEGNEDGSFELTVPRKKYNSLAVVRGYAIDYLETWIRNIPNANVVNLNNLKIGAVEVYGVNPKIENDKIVFSADVWSLNRYLYYGTNTNEALTPGASTVTFSVYADGNELNVKHVEYDSTNFKFNIIVDYGNINPKSIHELKVIAETTDFGYQIGESISLFPF